MKLVINKGYGPFSVSSAAVGFMAARGDAGARAELGVHSNVPDRYYLECARNNPHLLAAMEQLGPEVTSGNGARLAVVETPDDDYLVRGWGTGQEELVVHPGHGVKLMEET